jgi:hypothetical protein
MIGYLLILSCSKHADTVTPQNVAGNWQWVNSYLDYPPFIISPQDSGLLVSINFNADHTWKYYINGTLSDSGTYNTGHGTKPEGGNIHQNYEYDSIFSKSQVYQDVVYNQNLMFSGQAVYYYKISNDSLIFDPAYVGIIGGGSVIWTKN